MARKIAENDEPRDLPVALVIDGGSMMNSVMPGMSGRRTMRSGKAVLVEADIFDVKDDHAKLSIWIAFMSLVKAGAEHAGIHAVR